MLKSRIGPPKKLSNAIYELTKVLTTWIDS